ncbi:hypothetical protein BH23GEM6_BH23GEM6_12590 [soil metagenome]
MKAGLRVYWPWLLGGLVWSIVVVGLLLALYTRTGWGRERILAFTLETLGGQLNGTLYVQRMAGNVFTGAKLYELRLEDEFGEPLVSADSAYIEYRLPTFLGGDVVIQHLEIFSPRLSLVRMPGDTLWNYQRVLKSEPDPEAVARATLIERMRLFDATVTVAMEWGDDPDLSPAEQRRVLEGALTDTARLMAVEAPGGFLRLMNFAIQKGTVSELFIGPDERGGTYLNVDSLAADVRLWRDPPLQVRHLVGELNLREGRLRFNVPRIVLPASEARLVGEVDLRGDDPVYHVVVGGDRIAFADMQWLYPLFPDEGGGALRLRLQTRPEGFYFFARDLDLRAPGTRVTGQFGMLLGDTIRFVDADLQADPLDVRTVEQMLPAGLPVRGLVIGGSEIQSPQS